MNKEIGFMANYHIVNAIARTFAADRPCKTDTWEGAARSRMFLRESSVQALRYLWKTGTPDQRVTIACRVAVWMGRDVKAISARILAREKARGAIRTLEKRR